MTTVVHVRVFMTLSVFPFFLSSLHSCGDCKRHPLGVKELLKAYWACRHAHCVTAVWLNGKPRGCRGYIASHLWPAPQLTAHCLCVYSCWVALVATAVYSPSVYPPQTHIDKVHTPDACMPIERQAWMFAYQYIHLNRHVTFQRSESLTYLFKHWLTIGSLL